MDTGTSVGNPAYINILNMSPNSELSVNVNGKLLASGLMFKEQTKFLPASCGTYEFKVIKNGDEVIEQKIEFENDMICTVVITGGSNPYEMELIFNDTRYVPHDKALVRMVNLSHSEAGLNIKINGKKKLVSLEHGESGYYIELDPGEYTIEAADAESGQVKYRKTNMALTGGKCYACYILSPR